MSESFSSPFLRPRRSRLARIHKVRSIRIRKTKPSAAGKSEPVKNEKETGTGHNSVVKTEAGWYIVYHGRDPGEPYRTMRIAKLHVDRGTLFVEAI